MSLENLKSKYTHWIGVQKERKAEVKKAQKLLRLASNSVCYYRHKIKKEESQ